ncbi:MAG TPA: stage V sporulation protein AE [Halanaerobiales bacterium]|nr:stage V sporulation protein AE [Halanaerobiales bacterium]
MGNYLTAFLIGGLICVLGQLFLDNTKYTPAHLLVALVVLGSIFTGLGWYEPLIKFAGAGMTVPVSNFGYVLTRGVLEEASRDGLMGLFKGLLETASAGISASVVIAFFIALIFNPKS